MHAAMNDKHHHQRGVLLTNLTQTTLLYLLNKESILSFMRVRYKRNFQRKSVFSPYGVVIDKRVLSTCMGEWV